MRAGHSTCMISSADYAWWLTVSKSSCIPHTKMQVVPSVDFSPSTSVEAQLKALQTNNEPWCVLINLTQPDEMP